MLLLSGIYSQNVYAQEELAPTAFAECPAKAFLTQGKQPATYSVNLVTGDYNVIALIHGTTSSLNGVGFNTNDNFFYGWSYEHKQPARIHNDWQIEPLLGVNSTDSNYFVGDVSITENKYYVYRKGAGYGLYSIGLDPEADDYLQMNRVIDGSELFIRIYDMAFHPTDGYAYAVDATGFLFKVSATDGAYQNLGYVGAKGTFGATYFDVNGSLYLGRNNDGAIFRIAIDSGNYEAELFAMGPAAGTNDGSRCALAPISDGTDTLVDYGDAPDSYGTSLASNGARHGLSVSPTLFLGASVDGESDSSFYPLSDDDNSATNDEDGVQFVTNIVENETSIALVTASDVGYLSAWIDYDRNGQFDTGEQVITDQLTTAGESSFYFNVPNGVSAGQSWARFRISSTAGLPATGGTTDGEVEDLSVNIQQQDVVVTAYPSPTEWTTVAFEDNWPFFGDYDMNDLVFYLRNTIYSNDAGISRVVIEGELAAAGASYHNGFGIRLPGVLRSEIDEANIEFTVNGLPVTGTSSLEINREEAIFIIANDIYDFVSPGEACTYYRTEAGCGSAVEMSFTISIPMIDAVEEPLSGVFDPFMFATPGEWHGPQFATPPGRGYEIHLKNQAPTEAFNQQLFDSIGQDVSSPSNGIYFQSSGGMPWAIEVGTRWDYPLEFHEITQAYPPFTNFAESNGEEDVYWYDSETAVSSHIFTD
ncbi:LruC domain-containing protein [Granulosicoccus sp.]|nr:LruC domain-containing protein [Granulosicoccus sp.]MDB4224695.1 LruC domain-containing protein [Granulosicoccus sp.]